MSLKTYLLENLGCMVEVRRGNLYLLAHHHRYQYPKRDASRVRLGKYTGRAKGIHYLYCKEAVTNFFK